MGQREDIEEALGKVWGDRYEILEFVGRGGMGLVFKAQQLGMDRQVALKVIHRRLCQDEKQVQRFEQEAKTSSRLSHPNSIRVFDYGKSDDGRLYMAMEFLQGNTLGQLISKERTLEPLRVIHIARQMLKSLAEAHQLGLVHRDLKPENIVICEIYGETDFVKVLDFGIAKAIGPTEEQVNLTQTGFICGTPRYLSPEQALGQEVDGRADLYSVGVLMYEMLTGRPPFIGENPISIVMKHVHDEPPPLKLPGRYGADGQRLVWLVGRLLEKNTDRRPDLAERIVQFLDGELTQEELVGTSAAPMEPRGATGFRQLGQAVEKKNRPDPGDQESEVWAQVHDPSLPADESLPPPLPVEALLSSVPLSNAADTAMLDRNIVSLDEVTLVPDSDDTALIARNDLIGAEEVDPQTLPAHEIQGATRILSGADVQASLHDTSQLQDGAETVAPILENEAAAVTAPTGASRRNTSGTVKEPMWARAMAIAAVMVSALVFTFWYMKKSSTDDLPAEPVEEVALESQETPVVPTRIASPTPSTSEVGKVEAKPVIPRAVIEPDMGQVVGDALADLKVPVAVRLPPPPVVPPPAPAPPSVLNKPSTPPSAPAPAARPAPKVVEPPAPPPAPVVKKAPAKVTVPKATTPSSEKKPVVKEKKPPPTKKRSKPARKPAKKKSKPPEDPFAPF